MNSIIEAIKINNEKNPDKMCIADYDGISYTYKAYWELINSVASFFVSKGLKKRECVIIESVQSSLFPAITLGVQLAGGVSVPVERNVPINRLLEIVHDTDPKFIVCPVSRLSDDREITMSSILSYNEQGKFDVSKMTLPEGRELAEVLFTTGTTGKSKGIMITHEANVALGQNIAYGVQMKKDNVELVPVPINHSYGLRSFYASMYNGSSVVILDGFAQPRNFFLAIEKFNITSMALVPALINMMLRISKDYIKKYSEQLDYIQSGSAALTEDIKNKLCTLLPNSRLYNFYGSTEAGRCCVLDYSKDRNKAGCIGKPAYNASFEIFSDEGEIILSSNNNIGRLGCKGKMNMLGYWKTPQETQQVMIGEYILTNDLCYIEEGYIYYVGRKDDVINVGGNNVSPMEIEELANSHDFVQESVCIPVKDVFLGQVPKLYVVLKEGVQYNQSSLMDYLSNALDDFKIPKSIEVIEKIPRMYNGKIDRKSLI